MPTLNELAKEVHQNAVDHGWWEKEPSFPEVIALCHSELSEALEEYRSGYPNLYYNCDLDAEDERCICNPECTGCGASKAFIEFCASRYEKPEGIAVELADCIIRILDYCGRAGIDIDGAIRIKHEYNKTRPNRHGGKRI
jgi:NTP pyrophosphatase (non-canonical NTP hydrolase)